VQIQETVPQEKLGSWGVSRNTVGVQSLPLWKYETSLLIGVIDMSIDSNSLKDKVK
jgi:hypothetical protein